MSIAGVETGVTVFVSGAAAEGDADDALEASLGFIPQIPGWLSSFFVETPELPVDFSFLADDDEK